jgi:hypothetical protein
VVGIDESGRALVAWLRLGGPGIFSGSTVRARSIPVTGPMSTIRAVTTTPEELSELSLDLNPAGQGWLAWVRYADGGRLIRARALSSDANLGPSPVVAPPGSYKFGPTVTVDADGDALFGWGGYEGGCCGGDYGAWVRRVSAAGTPDAPVFAAESGSEPALDSDAEGDAYLAWPRSTNRDTRIEGRTFSRAGALGPVRTLSLFGQPAADPRVAVNASGRTVVTWSRSDGANWRVQARTVNPVGGLGATETLSVAGAAGLAPAVDIGSHGDAVDAWSAWLYGDPGAPHTIQAATGP